MNNTPCEYGQHQPHTNRMYHYWDDDNGIPARGVKICVECYAAHILKYYPESKIAKHIIENPDEYKNKTA
jgi:hypothetical protein